MATVLAIETSCDETAAAVVRDGHLVLSDPVATQIDIHRKYGGVVPELASRNHIVDIVPVVQDALEQADCRWSDIDAIGVTQGPGLVGALLVGVQFAKTLAFAHNKVLVPVHHLAGHLHAVYLHRPEEERPEGPSFPHVALAVSGGHTALYLVNAPGEVQQIANTRDDAVGEAFDKVARMFGLGYPGGPIVEKLARPGDVERHVYTMPRFKDGSLDFSFSGLKTAVLTTLKKLGGHEPTPEERANVLASFQHAAVKQLVHRTMGAAVTHQVNDVVLAGGVACNSVLRDAMRTALAAHDINMHVPRPRWCTDNAAMIGGVASAIAGELSTFTHRVEDRRLDVIASWRLDR
ncbi:MAG: tRNA (adenosine(37)-N6)-threonylcarbamoyltransferase complex transferase subunit TsaD [Myxococcota bacterium]|nr:tRNA (adenosine(37)-N6)-threonylcarbamoyltransferase complex transferase subunit TsaD [Myxococcota bacterium]